MPSDEFFYPNPESDEKFTIERRYNRLTLYWYDPVAQVSRPIVATAFGINVWLPLADMEDGVDCLGYADLVITRYPDFEFFKDFGVKTELKNRGNTFTDEEIDEIYFRSIAKNFHKFKHKLLGKFA